MSVINTNIMAMIGQQNLSKSQSALQTAMERLSSGLRINSAKDDAAGQAIANRMAAQITGLAQAQRNANDGISVAQTAEGALNQVNDNLQRIRELTVQAMNGTNSQEDLNSIQAEINQRLTEINRISEQTDFNGVKVLAKDQNLVIQVGANDNESISINLEEITAETLGLGTFNINGPQGTPTAATSADIQAVWGETTSIASVTLGAGTTLSNLGDALANNLGLASGRAAFSANALVDNNGSWFAKVTLGSSTTALSTAEINTLRAQGLDIDASATTASFYIAIDPADASITGTTATVNLDASAVSAADLVIGRTSGALATLDAALEKVDVLRSDLGAIQNRFESAITNLQTNETNLSAARSRIQDADYAEEVSNMTRAQILQQAGTSVLAQANQVPQSVLSLLG